MMPDKLKELLDEMAKNRELEKEKLEQTLLKKIEKIMMEEAR